MNAYHYHNDLYINPISWDTPVKYKSSLQTVLSEFVLPLIDRAGAVAEGSWISRSEGIRKEGILGSEN